MPNPFDGRAPRYARRQVLIKIVPKGMKAAYAGDMIRVFYDSIMREGRLISFRGFPPAPLPGTLGALYK